MLHSAGQQSVLLDVLRPDPEWNFRGCNHLGKLERKILRDPVCTLYCIMYCFGTLWRLFDTASAICACVICASNYCASYNWDLNNILSTPVFAVIHSVFFRYMRIQYVCFRRFRVFCGLILFRYMWRRAQMAEAQMTQAYKKYNFCEHIQWNCDI
jgi:hypothetical protein